MIAADRVDRDSRPSLAKPGESSSAAWPRPSRFNAVDGGEKDDVASDVKLRQP
jgi:hypothetical protein